jgi:hypothetical protein
MFCDDEGQMIMKLWWHGSDIAVEMDPFAKIGI